MRNVAYPKVLTKISLVHSNNDENNRTRDIWNCLHKNKKPLCCVPCQTGCCGAARNKWFSIVSANETSNDISWFLNVNDLKYLLSKHLFDGNLYFRIVIFLTMFILVYWVILRTGLRIDTRAVCDSANIQFSTLRMYISQA